MAVPLHLMNGPLKTDVILILPGGKANRDFVRLVVEENQAGRPFRLDDLLLLTSYGWSATWLFWRLLLSFKSLLQRQDQSLSD